MAEPLVAIARLPAGHDGCHRQSCRATSPARASPSAPSSSSSPRRSTQTTRSSSSPFADDYSFGILQSGIHWAWFTARCSTLKGDFRYTSDTVFDTFPWPQSPTLAQVKAVAEAAVSLRALRREIMAANGWSLRDLYRTLETPGTNRLRDAHAALDSAVRAAYGMKEKEDTLAFLLRLNLDLADVGSERRNHNPARPAPKLCQPGRLYQRRLHQFAPTMTTDGNQVQPDVRRRRKKEPEANHINIPFLLPMNKQALLKSSLFAFLFAARFVSAQSPSPSLAQTKVAAEAGDPASQDKLAEAFVMRADSERAEIWYRKAAEQGLAHAQGRLGNMLLMHSRVAVSRTPAARAAMGEEAVHWIILAANQGDKRGQADFADICLEGKLVKRDLIEAYKWGELASKGSMIDVATIAGRSCRDAATLEMAADHIAEAQKRAAVFVPHQLKASDLPEPSWVKQIKLNGISGTSERRLAIINGKTFQTGDHESLKLGEKTVTVRCIEIRQTSVVISIDGLDGTREVKFP